MSANARRYFGCCLPLALAIFGCGALLLLTYAGQIFVQVQRVPDAAMAPILEPGAQVIIDNTAHWSVDPQRGSIVTIARPERHVFRRVVGLPGETIEIRAGQVTVDGTPCNREQPLPGGPCNPGRVDPSAPDLGPLTLGPNEYFVLSENWAVSDSRTWGPIQREDIFGTPSFRRADDGSLVPIFRPSTRTPTEGAPRPDPTPAGQTPALPASAALSASPAIPASTRDPAPRSVPNLSNPLNPSIRLAIRCVAGASQPAPSS